MDRARDRRSIVRVSLIWLHQANTPGMFARLVGTAFAVASLLYTASKLREVFIGRPLHRSVRTLTNNVLPAGIYGSMGFTGRPGPGMISSGSILIPEQRYCRDCKAELSDGKNRQRGAESVFQQALKGQRAQTKSAE